MKALFYVRWEYPLQDSDTQIVMPSSRLPETQPAKEPSRNTETLREIVGIGTCGCKARSGRVKPGAGGPYACLEPSITAQVATSRCYLGKPQCKRRSSSVKLSASSG